MRKRITVDLDQDLLDSLDRSAALSRQSRNQLVLESLRCHLKQLERERIDREFLAMADDPQYQAEQLTIEAEFASASEAAWAQLDP